MKSISATALAPLCLGVHAAKVWQDTLVFHRFPAPVGRLYETPRRARIRRDCPSGVRIRFVSDTTRLDLVVRYGPAARQLFRGTLLVDGEPHPWGPEHPMATWEGTPYHECTRRERLFDLWLPHLCRTDLVKLAIDERADWQPVPRPSVRWLALGDSITQGMTAESPTATHTARIALQAEAECLNLGVGGSIFIPAYAGAVPSLPDIDLVTIAFGSNDFHKAVPLERMHAALTALLAALQDRYPGKPLYLLTPVSWVDPPEPNALGHTLDDYRECIRATGGHAKVRMVPGPEMIPCDPACFVDNVHPNNRGFAQYAEHLARYLDLR